MTLRRKQATPGETDRFLSRRCRHRSCPVRKRYLMRTYQQRKKTVNVNVTSSAAALSGFCGAFVSRRRLMRWPSAQAPELPAAAGATVLNFCSCCCSCCGAPTPAPEARALLSGCVSCELAWLRIPARLRLLDCDSRAANCSAARFQDPLLCRRHCKLT
jgi:hypothetical protein